MMRKSENPDFLQVVRSKLWKKSFGKRLNLGASTAGTGPIFSSEELIQTLQSWAQPGSDHRTWRIFDMKFVGFAGGNNFYLSSKFIYLPN